MKYRKVFSTMALLTGVYYLGTTSPPNLGEVLDYSSTNSKHQEVIINHSIDSRRKQGKGFENKTLGNFSRVLTEELEKPVAVKENFDSNNPNKNTSRLEKLSDFLKDKFMEDLD